MPMASGLVVRIVTCGLVLASLPSYAADAVGFIRPENCNEFVGTSIYLQKLRDRKLSRTIVLKVPSVYLLETWPGDWFDVPGMECATASQCVNASHSKVRISRVSEARSVPLFKKTPSAVEGSFSIEFRDGRRIEGSFKAKFRRPEKPMICE